MLHTADAVDNLLFGRQLNLGLICYLEVYNDIFVRNELERNLIDLLKTDCRHDLLYKRILPLDTGDHALVQEIINVFVYIGIVSCGTALVVSFLILSECLRLGALEFVIREAIPAHLLHLREQVMPCFALLPFFGNNDAVECIFEFYKFAIINATAEEACIGFHRIFCHAVVHHLYDERKGKIIDVLHYAAFELSGNLLMLIDNANTTLLRLCVFYNSYDGLFVVLY